VTVLHQEILTAVGEAVAIAGSDNYCAGAAQIHTVLDRGLKR
jgi:hypothetical protein